MHNQPVVPTTVVDYSRRKSNQKASNWSFRKEHGMVVSLDTAMLPTDLWRNVVPIPPRLGHVCHHHLSMLRPYDNLVILLAVLIF